MGARAGRYKLGARANKYKYGAQAGKYKLGARAGKEAKGQGPGNTNTPKKETYETSNSGLSLEITYCSIFNKAKKAYLPRTS